MSADTYYNREMAEKIASLMQAKRDYIDNPTNENYERMSDAGTRVQVLVEMAWSEGCRFHKPEGK